MVSVVENRSEEESGRWKDEQSDADVEEQGIDPPEGRDDGGYVGERHSEESFDVCSVQTQNKSQLCRLSRRLSSVLANCHSFYQPPANLETN